MFRGAVALLLVVLAVSLVAITVRSWQAESRMAEQIGALTAQLKELAERPQTPPAPPVVASPIEITGRAFRAPDKPAWGAPLSIIDVTDGNTIRQVKSETDGAFTSGPLAGGDFAIFGPASPAGTDGPLYVQSAPIAAYPGVDVPHQDFDLRFDFGRLGIELSRPLPDFEVEGEGKLESRIFIKVLTPRMLPTRWTTSSALPPKWPVYISRGPRATTPDVIPSSGLWCYEILDNSQISGGLAGTLFTGDEGRLPSGECQVVAAVMAHNIEPPAEEEIGARNLQAFAQREGYFKRRFAHFGPYRLRDSAASSEDLWIRHLWFDLLNREPRVSRSQSLQQEWVKWGMETFDPTVAAKVQITAGSKITIRLEIPDDLESRVRNAFAGEAEVEKAKAAWSEGSPFHRHVKITVTGSEPLDVDQAFGGSN